jgi:NIMA (never in mitosis gene a)-related kinase
MEFADGGDLLGKINNHKRARTNFREEELWSILLQVLRGLKKLHSLRILHRDIKCANVFICKDGTAKIGDLNVSKVNKRGLAYTQTGTPYYASPEVWKDQPYDSKSDIWSVGCVLYEAAALDPPFRGSSMEELYQKVIRGHYSPLPAFYSEDLHNILRSLLQVTPSLRPSAEQLFQMPLVIRHDTSSRNFDATVQGGLLGTIVLPRNMSQLSSRLPAPKYERRIESSIPGARVSEPALQVPRPVNRLPVHQTPEVQRGRLRAYGLDVVKGQPSRELRPPLRDPDLRQPYREQPRNPLRPISRENVPSRGSYLPHLVQREDPRAAKYAYGNLQSRIQGGNAYPYQQERARIVPRAVVPKWWG